MTKNVKIAIAIGSGLAVGVGGWYLYQYIQKQKEAKKLAGLTASEKPTSTTNPVETKPSTITAYASSSATSPTISLASNATQQSLAGAKPKRKITEESLAENSNFNGQEMVTRYQRPFWTVGG